MKYENNLCVNLFYAILIKFERIISKKRKIKVFYVINTMVFF